MLTASARPSFQTLFEAFLENRNSILFLSGLNNLTESDEKEINKLYAFNNQLLNPLSIIIRLAYQLESPIKIINTLIRLKCHLDVDYGYHGDRHPNRPSPPLIETIQLSLGIFAEKNKTVEFEKAEKTDRIFDLYNEIAHVLITSGACINKISDNITPLCAAYHPVIPEIIRIGNETPEICPDKIAIFNKQKRNAIIFNELLSHKNINVLEHDIVSNVKILWRKLDEKDSGEKWKRSFGFQLLNIIDYQLKKIPNKTIEEQFFKPLFAKYVEQSAELATKLIKNSSSICTQEFLNHAQANGYLFSNVTRYYGSQLPELAQLLHENQQFYSDDMVNPFLKGSGKELQSLAGIYPVPTQYFGTRGQVGLQGFIYHLSDTIPLLHAKADFTTVKRIVHYDSKSVLTYSFEDFTYKIHHYTPAEMVQKMWEANQRRLRLLPETRPRQQLNRSGGMSDDKSIKLTYKKHYTLFFNETNHELQDLPTTECLAGVYHDEMLCLYIGKPLAIFTVKKVHLTRKASNEKKLEWIDTIHDEFLHLRALQTQRYIYYLTGEYLPIATTTSTENKPIIINRTDFECLNSIFTHEKNQSKLKYYALLLQKNSNFPLHLVNIIINFFHNRDLLSKWDLENLLLWSLQMGFQSTTHYLLKYGVSVNLQLGSELNILDSVLQKNYLDEASLLLHYGLIPKNETLFKKISQKFPNVYFNQTIDDNLPSEKMLLLQLFKTKINVPSTPENKLVYFAHYDLSHFKFYWHADEKLTIQKKIFKALSRDILEKPYLDQPHDYLFFENKRAFHPNHGTTHGIRQFIYTKHYLTAILNSGKILWHNVARSLTKEEISCLELCAFLFRSGRTNEKSWSQDKSNPARSAAIFKDIALELGYDELLVKAIADNCFIFQKPLTLEFAFLKNDLMLSRLKIILIDKILKLSHETDLVRCSRKIETIRHIRRRVEDDLCFLLENKETANELTNQFFKLAAIFCVETGAPVTVPDLQIYSGGRSAGNTALAIKSALEVEKTIQRLDEMKLSTISNENIRCRL